MSDLRKITFTRSRGQILVSGDTYPERHLMRAHGGRWDRELCRWILPDTERASSELARIGASEGEPVSGPVPTAQQAPVVMDVIPDLEAALAPIRLDVTVALQGASDARDLSRTVERGLSALQERFEAMERPTRVEIVSGGVVKPVEGLAHAMLPTLIRCLSAKLHVWLAGPSGSGKTHGAEQAAQALGLSFELQGAMTMAHELTGFVDAGGRYHETPFVRAFRNGGLILLDELDAGSNEALLALNAALANGIMSLPSGEVVRAHADFRCIGAANTFGAGATSEYVGRTRIDAAFLQRFGARLAWGYDLKLERVMSGNPEWCARVQKARVTAAKAGVKVMITPRASQAGAKLIAAGMTPDEAANLTYLADLSDAQRAIVEGKS